MNRRLAEAKSCLGKSCVGDRRFAYRHFKRHEHSLERRVLDWDRIVEDYHDAVTRISFKRAAVLDDARSKCFVVLTRPDAAAFFTYRSAQGVPLLGERSL
jgi:hypothetical protein